VTARAYCSVFALMACALVGCSEKKLGLEGAVTIDGRVVDDGTIRFEAAEQAANKGMIRTGGAVHDGKFQILAKDGLPAGAYRVIVSGYRKTGRKVTDPQRGELDERVPMSGRETSADVTISPENAQKVEIALTSSG